MLWSFTEPIDHTSVVTLHPNQEAHFNVIFSPTEVKKYESEIKLFITDNPYEILRFSLVGDVFFEEIVIEKIRKVTNLDSECCEAKWVLIIGGSFYYS